MTKHFNITAVITSDGLTTRMALNKKKHIIEENIQEVLDSSSQLLNIMMSFRKREYEIQYYYREGILCWSRTSNDIVLV